MSSTIDHRAGVQDPQTGKHSGLKEMNYDIRIVETSAEFDALEEEWNGLLGQTNVTIFQTFEWVRTWWKYFNYPTDKLHILVFTVENRLVGIAPLYKEHLRIGGIRLATHLQYIGNSLSDYADFIILPGFEQGVYSAFARHLISTARDWDIFDIEDVNETSSLCHFLPGVLENNKLALYRYQGNVCPQLVLPSPEEIKAKGSGPATNYNFRRKMKKLQGSYNAEVQVIRDASDDIEKGIDDFSKLHGDRWKSLGHPSAFDDPYFREFHVEFSRKFAQRGWLKIFFLKIDGRPIAVSYDFNYNHHIYMYHSNAHGSDDIMKCSPGFLIRSLAMAEGIEEGMCVFDFLRGDEPYKYKEWNAVDSKNYLFRSTSPTRSGKVRFTLFLQYELVTKIIKRVKREYYDYRRFTFSQSSTFEEKITYVADKFTKLFILGCNFILRHSPIRALRQVQITQSSHTPQSLSTDDSASSKNNSTSGHSRKRESAETQ
jgi:CelD/BcsL family acetyltransferase involved in cellulose biosynthesis